MIPGQNLIDRLDAENAELLRLRHMEQCLHAMGLSYQLLRGSRDECLRAILGENPPPWVTVHSRK